jgi:hypothetical protein
MKLRQKLLLIMVMFLIMVGICSVSLLMFPEDYARFIMADVLEYWWAFAGFFVFPGLVLFFILR